MGKGVSKEILAGFIKESQEYLPSILNGIKSCQKNAADSSEIEEAHRQMHIIKGASSMVGLSSLSQAAYYTEEILEDITESRLEINEEIEKILLDMTDRIGGYLDNILSGTIDEEYFLGESTLAYRRLRRLPESGDEEAVKEALKKNTASLDKNGDEESTSDSEGIFMFDEEDCLEGEENTNQQNINLELLEVFSLEAEEHLRNISTLLSELEKKPEQRDSLQGVRRSVHTLKGAAGVVGFKEISQLAHRMEDLLDILYEGGYKLDAEKIDLLFASADALEDMAGGSARDTQELYIRYSALLDNITPIENFIPSCEESQANADFLENITEQEKNIDKISESILPSKQNIAQVKKRDMVRVPLERLNELVRLVSELVITRTTFEQYMNRFVHDTVDELNPSIKRLQQVSSNLETKYEVSTLGDGSWAYDLRNNHTPPSSNSYEFDELEFDRYTEFHQLSRALTETVGDIKMLSGGLESSIGDFKSILNRQALLSSEIQDKLMRIRMIPMSTLETRLHRTVRTIAGEQNKLVELVLEGKNTELDKTMLEEISAPLLHLLRNAVDHGIESPEARMAIKKNKKGCINLKTFNDGNSIVIQVRDDGTGLNANKIRSKAVNGGYITETDAARLNDEELYSLIFLPGFSTAEKITEVSGRGVGMDIVKNNVEKLKGSLTLNSTPGEGSVFSIRLPMTLAITRALLVGVQDKIFAIPTDSVIQILRIEEDDIEYIGKKPVIRVGKQVYSLVSLGEVLKICKSSYKDENHLTVLIFSIGGKKVAVAPDSLHGEHEIVVKTLGNHLCQVHGITGATIMGDGSTVLILNPMELFEDMVSQTGNAIQKPKPEIKAAGTEHRKTVSNELTIMIVDDSVSVRRVLSNLLKSAGWQTVTAKDGLDALENIQSFKRLPDAILLDIEMPRMNGYELLSTLRRQALYKNIPIIMSTSRSGKKHRKKAMELGASEYIIKPCQDEVLIDIIRKLTEEAS